MTAERSKIVELRESLPGSLEEQLASVAKGPAARHNSDMNDLTRHELEAKLESIEARMDGRVASIEASVSSIRAEMRGFLGAQAEREKRIDAELKGARRESSQRFEHIDKTLSDVRSSLSAQKYWLAGIGVAVVIGIMGANATIFSGAKTFFDGGVERSEVKALLEEVRAQTVETRALIERRGDSAAVTPASPPDPQATE